MYQRPIPPTIKPFALHPVLNRDPVRIQPGPFVVQGLRASDLEARVYRVLKVLGWTDDEIEFQVDFLGGRLPGGVVLDYVVWAFGGPQIIEVNGDYWHTRSEQIKQRDAQRRAYIEAAWRRAYGYLTLASGDLATDQMAYDLLLRKIGRH